MDLNDSLIFSLKKRDQNAANEGEHESFKDLIKSETPRTPQSPKILRSSPRCSPRCSPRRISSSKLPVKTLPTMTKFLLKDLRLPPDESVMNLNEPTTNKVTPEKLMEELRVEVKNKRKKMRMSGDLDDEISLSIPFVPETEKETLRPRMSLRNRIPIIIDAPDLIYEDPLEIARQTFQNTRSNSGYRQVKLIYTTERREGRKRSLSPEPAFSKKRGITRHFLETTEESEETGLKFDRVLKLFEVEDDDELEIKADKVLKLEPPTKSILKEPKQTNNQNTICGGSVKIVHVKRVCYAEDVLSSSPPPTTTTKNNKTRRKLSAAKRMKKED